MKEHIDMARSEKNLTAVFTDTAAAIRAKTNTSEMICPLDFADKINAIETGGTGGGMKAFFEAGGKCSYSKCKSFNGIINYSDTVNVTDARNMFYICDELVEAPNMDMSNFTTTSYMFSGCTSLTEIPTFNTSNVKSMSHMFDSCTSLTTIQEIDTSKVTNMNYMFRRCTSLTNIAEINTSSVTNMECMFTDCRSLSTVPQFDTSNV